MLFNYTKFNTTDVKNIILHYSLNFGNNLKDIYINGNAFDYYMERTLETFFITIYVEKGANVDYCFKKELNNNK